MILLKLWRLRTIIDFETPNSPDTHRFLLTVFAPISWRTASESSVLSLSGLVWSLWFLQPEWNFFKRLLTVLSPMILQMFLIDSPACRPSWTGKTYYRIGLCCTYICEAFKSHMECNYAQFVSAPTTTMLTVTLSIYLWFEIIVSHKQARAKIFQNCWVILHTYIHTYIYPFLCQNSDVVYIEVHNALTFHCPIVWIGWQFRLSIK